jgi:hypothetical protein
MARGRRLITAYAGSIQLWGQYSRHMSVVVCCRVRVRQRYQVSIPGVRKFDSKRERMESAHIFKPFAHADYCTSRARSSTCTHTVPQQYARTHTLSNTNAHTHAHTRTHARTYTRSLANTPHTGTHTQIDTHAHRSFRFFLRRASTGIGNEFCVRV